jgi:hypothetical protein
MCIENMQAGYYQPLLLEISDIRGRKSMRITKGTIADDKLGLLAVHGGNDAAAF